MDSRADAVGGLGETDAVLRRERQSLAGSGEKQRHAPGAIRGIPTRVYLIGMVIYLVAISAYQLWNRGFVGPDTILPFMLLAAIVIGQARTFLRDWIPFIIIFFAWQLLRGYADQAANGAGFPIHDTDLIAAERLLFGGQIPTVVLQNALYVPGQIQWYDVMATTFYGFHFVLPLLFAYLLWIRDRDLYWRFVYALMAVSFAAFFTYVVFPAVPPWLAGEQKLIRDGNRIVQVHLIRDAVVDQFRVGGGIPSYLLRRSNPNPIAAMPSLHAAYPTLVLLFGLFNWRPVAPVALLYCLGLWFSVVYIGDHYVVDVLAGVVYAVVVFFGTRAVLGVLARRRAGRVALAHAGDVA